MRLGPADEALVGDLVQEFEAGRSRGWFWRQVLAAVWHGAWRGLTMDPVRAIKSVTAAWAVLVLLFWLLGDAAANGLAGLLWGWERQRAYAGQQAWWPFWICASFVSYSGFALSGWLIARLNRRNPAILLAHAASILLALVGSSVMIEVLTARWGRVPLPHALFYVFSVALPYFWRAGLLLAPLATLLGGLAAGRMPSTREVT
jgi:hypothetical protein